MRGPSDETLWGVFWTGAMVAISCLLILGLTACSASVSVQGVNLGVQVDPSKLKGG